MLVNTSLDFISTISPEIANQSNSNMSFQFEPDSSSQQKKSLADLERDLEDVIGTICGLQMKHKEMNIVFEQCEKLVKSFHNFANRILESSYAKNPIEAINLTAEIMIDNLQKQKSQYKRNKTYKGNNIGRKLKKLFCFKTRQVFL